MSKDQKADETPTLAPGVAEVVQLFAHAQQAARTPAGSPTADLRPGPVARNPLGQWAYDVGSLFMEVSCHHQRKGACGGCYARAVEVLRALESEGNARAAAFFQALVEEGEKLNPKKGR